MNALVRGVMRIAKACVGNSITGNAQLLHSTPRSILGNTRTCLGNLFQGFEQVREGSSLIQMHKRGKPRTKPKKKKNPLDGKPFAKGTIVKVVIRKPKKPNSANRKCVVVKLSTGKEMTAFVPGIGHTLQEHQTVLVRPGKVKDTPGVNIRCVRGKYDLGHPVKQK